MIVALDIGRGWSKSEVFLLSSHCEGRLPNQQAGIPGYTSGINAICTPARVRICLDEQPQHTSLNKRVFLGNTSRCPRMVSCHNQAPEIGAVEVLDDIYARCPPASII